MVTGYYYFAGRIRSTDSFTYRQFVDALNQSKVEEVLLKPNASGTAGKVIVEMKEGDTYQLYVTDIAQVDTLLRESYGNVNVVVDDIPQDKSFINSALMILATAAIFIFFFAMINRQNGGTNAQMMNFGKSRARMSSPSDTKVTFKDVAGLEEENLIRKLHSRMSQVLRRRSRIWRKLSISSETLQNTLLSEPAFRKASCLSALPERARP